MLAALIPQGSELVLEQLDLGLEVDLNVTLNILEASVKLTLELCS